MSAKLSVKRSKNKTTLKSFGETGAPGKPKHPKRVAFQGELGAFSQQAIKQLLGPSAIPVPCERFDRVFAALKAGSVDAAVVPLENTLAGSVHENFDLLLQHPFEITAETSVRVVHNLIVRPGVAAKLFRCRRNKAK